MIEDACQTHGAEKCADEILNIPLYSEMTKKESNYVISYIKEFYNKKI